MPNLEYQWRKAFAAHMSAARAPTCAPSVAIAESFAARAKAAVCAPPIEYFSDENQASSGRGFHLTGRSTCEPL